MPLGSTGKRFNGGTITQPLVIATTDGNVIPLKVVASWNAQNQDFFQVVNSDTNTRMLTVDVSGNTLGFRHTSEVDRNFTSDGGSVLGYIPGITAQGTTGARQAGFFDHAPASQPTGVAVTAAAIHAALVSLGLITA